MSTDSQGTVGGAPAPKARSFQAWMISNLAIGLGMSAFAALLIPRYVTEVTGNAADAGIVMAIISVAAVLGPVLGGLADKYRLHRLIMSLGVFGMGVGFAFYAVSSETQALYALDAIIIGVSVAAVMAVSPVFIVGVDMPPNLQSRRLTAFNLTAPVGQIVGGALMGALATASWSFSARFWVAGGLLMALGVLTYLVSGQAAAEIRTEPPSAATDSDTATEGKKSGFGRALFSVFGAFLFVLLFTSIADNGINNQISNIMPEVFSFSQAQTSTLISVAGLLNFAFFILAGWWMSRTSSVNVFLAGHLLRLVGSLLMALLGAISGVPMLVAAAAVLIFYQGLPFVMLASPVVAVRFSSVGAGTANGLVIGFLAIGSFVGSVLGGYLASTVGFNAINWMAVAAAVVGAAILLLVLVPADRRKRKAEAS